VHQLATDPTRDAQIRHLRDSHPVFRIDDARTEASGGTLRLSFGFTCGKTTFAPSVEFHGLQRDEAARAGTQTAQRLVRALAIVESFSYWKAYCSPVIEVALPLADAAETAWWESFWPKARGEFFYRNGIDFTAPGFLRITAVPGIVPAQEYAAPVPGGQGSAPPLVMFSGGKDSLALTYATRDEAVPATDFFLYNPTPGQRDLAQSLAHGGRVIEVRREILPELLELNASGHPNGHTPYSAYLALAALLAGYLRGNGTVLAGNSRSDDEPNVGSYLGMAVNHQWTKSHEYEAALGKYRDQWLPGTPAYSSPLRPLFELQIIRSLAPHMDAYLKTASCNKTKGLGWCRKCAKCAWVFLATSALFGHDLAVSKAGGDIFADPELSGLYEAMAGLPGAGDKPFECTGTEEEVRSAIQAAGQLHGDLAALTSCLRDPAVMAARPLDVLLKDWGQDDLMPQTLKERVRRAAYQ
jgi:UDP-N-acetyl-alpha-D-muramoyl-L-alanyl-L-glutamate epimerase